MQLRVAAREEDGTSLPILLIEMQAPMLSVSSAPLGGGLGLRRWVINATVHKSYTRIDPDVHLGELAAACGLDGDGVGFLTAVDVTERQIANDAGVAALVTVGLGMPTSAAAPDEIAGNGPGTINSVVRLPVRLAEAALVNAVMTATEAKVQALYDAGVAATGTASDAICVLCPADGDAEPFAGPRSTWGARIARATYQATRAGADAWCRRGEVS